MSTVIETGTGVATSTLVATSAVAETGVVVTGTVGDHDAAIDTPPSDGAWYEWLAFGGPLDPAGTVFAFALSVAATVGLVVLVAAVVRVVTGA